MSLEVTTGQDLEGFHSHLSVNENTVSPLLCRRNFCGPRTEADLAVRLALESAHCLQVLKWIFVEEMDVCQALGLRRS